MKIRIIRKFFEIELYSIIFYINIYNYRKLRNFHGDKIAFTFDGIGLVLLAKLLGINARRLSPDNSGYLSEFLDSKRVHIYASKKSDLDAFLSRKKNYSVISALDGYSRISDFVGLISDRVEHGDIILVGRGSPLQEDTVIELYALFPQCVFVTIGAFIEQSVKGDVYYPIIVDKLNLRMPYRLVKENLYGRLPFYFLNPFLFLYDAIVLKKFY